MTNKYKLPQEVLDVIADIGYTLEVAEDYATDKLNIQTKTHIVHAKKRLQELSKLLIVEAALSPYRELEKEV